MTEIGQAIFDLGRDDRVHGPHDEAIACHRSQGLRQHLRADPRNEPRQLGEAAGPMILQFLEDKESPLVGDPADEFVDERLDARIDRRVRIIGNFFERGHGGKSNSLFWVTMALSGAFFPLESIDISWMPHHPTQPTTQTHDTRNYTNNPP